MAGWGGVPGGGAPGAVPFWMTAPMGSGGVSGGVTGSGTGVVRAASAAVRRAQTGFLRYYVALMIVGIGAVALYFLIAST